MEGLKAMIRERLHGSPLVAKAIEQRPDLRDDPVGLLKYLEENGLVEDIFASLEASLQKQQGHTAPASVERMAHAAMGGEPACTAAHTDAELNASRQLVLRLGQGRAFLDYLDERDAAGRHFQWHVAFAGQRLRSRSVPAAVDPHFDETFLLELPGGSSRAGLLEQASPVHLVLACRGGAGAASADDPHDAGPGTVLCSHLLEWRQCLAAAGPIQLTAELLGVGRRRQLAVGVLHAEIELRPSGAPQELLNELSLASHIRSEEQQRADCMRRIFEDLDRWWAEYHELYAERNIRLCAQTENGLFLPVTSFVAPLEVGRALDSPYHALRWVSLIGSDPTTPAVDSAEPRWHTFPALWARGRATPDEKALLLCSLLLGYSLDAWCCLGTDAAGQPHAWVLVREQGDSSRPCEVTCWNPQSAARIPVDDARFLATYSSIDTVFNDQRLLVCHVGTVARMSVDFSNPRQWLALPLDPKSLGALRLYPTTRLAPFADLRPRDWGPPIRAEALEEAIEARLRADARAHREAAGLPTRFDEHLAQVLHVALASCELERVGASSQAPMFEHIVKRLCGPGEVFTAVPVQFNHLRTSLYWHAISERGPAQELLAAPPSAAFAVRARVLSYPEGAVVAWVMLAARGYF